MGLPILALHRQLKGLGVFEGITDVIELGAQQKNLFEAFGKPTPARDMLLDYLVHNARRRISFSPLLRNRSAFHFRACTSPRSMRSIWRDTRWLSATNHTTVSGSNTFPKKEWLPNGLEEDTRMFYSELSATRAAVLSAISGRALLGQPGKPIRRRVIG